MSTQNLLTSERLFRILFFMASQRSCSIKQLAQHFEIPISTVYRYMATLKNVHMIQETRNGHYILGPSCVQLGAAYRLQMRAENNFQPAMYELAEATGETIVLAVPFRDQAVCIDTVESQLPLRYSFTKGAVLSLLRGATAKSMLPFLDQGLIENLITESDILSPERKLSLREEIKLIKEQGYATSFGEMDEGVWAVAAPIFSRNGVIEGSISTIAPGFRAKERQAFLIATTVAAANRMSQG